MFLVNGSRKNSIHSVDPDKGSDPELVSTESISWI